MDNTGGPGWANRSLDALAGISAAYEAFIAFRSGSKYPGQLESTSSLRMLCDPVRTGWDGMFGAAAFSSG